MGVVVIKVSPKNLRSWSYRESVKVFRSKGRKWSICVTIDRRQKFRIDKMFRGIPYLLGVNRHLDRQLNRHLDQHPDRLPSEGVIYSVIEME